MGERVVRVVLAAGACAIAFALPAAPAAAAGNTYYATPSPSEVLPLPDCSQAEPCAIEDALSLAGDGDAVSLAGGKYTLPFPGLTIDEEIDFGAGPGTLATLQTTESGNVQVTEKADATLHDLRIQGLGNFELGSGTARRVFVAFVGAGDDACTLEKGTTLTDSVCWTRELSEEVEDVSHALSIASTGEGLDEPVILRNVTALASNAHGDAIHVLGAAGSKLAVDAANVIAHSASATDIVAERDLGLSETHVNIANSAFVTVAEDPSTVTVTAPGTHGNVQAVPSFVDPAKGDFHLNAGSPGLDGGLADAFVGSFDLDGASRAVPSCFGAGAVPDMGAYERAATGACPPPPPPPPPPFEARKPLFRVIKLTLDKRHGSGTLQIEVPNTGTVSLTGQGIKFIRRRASAAGDLVTLPIQAWAITLVRLKKRGKSHVKLKVVFEPRVGPTQRLTMGILLRKSRR